MFLEIAKEKNVYLKVNMIFPQYFIEMLNTGNQFEKIRNLNKNVRISMSYSGKNYSLLVRYPDGWEQIQLNLSTEEGFNSFQPKSKTHSFYTARQTTVLQCYKYPRNEFVLYKFPNKKTRDSSYDRLLYFIMELRKLRVLNRAYQYELSF